jgi:hypothetical protein
MNNEKKLNKSKSNSESVDSKKKKSNEIRDFGEISKLIFQEKVQANDDHYNYIKTKKCEYNYFKYLYNTFMQCIFALSSVISAILSYEIEFNTKEEDHLALKLSLFFCFISSCGIWITIIYEYYINCQIFALTKNLPESIWRKEKSNVTTLVITLIIFFLHPNPIFYGINVNIYNNKFHYTATYSLNSILTVFCLLRLWFFVKFYLIFSEYYSPRVQRLCQMNNFDTSLKFSMKANMIKTPYHAYLLLFFILLLYCSFCLRIFERVLDDVSGRNFSSFWNSIWCLIVTMTTVGYGDFYPSSTFGRTVGIISCICGVFLISMLIVTITNVLNFQGTEENVFLILKRLKLAQEKDELAAKLISRYMRLMKQLKSIKDTKIFEVEKNKARDEILLGLYYLKDKNSEIESTFPAYSNFDVVTDNIEMLDASVSNLRAKYDNLEISIDMIAKKLSS